MLKLIKEGDEFEKTFETKPEHSAKHLGSGNVNVLSTPSLILFMEEACRIFADSMLNENQTTVGIHVDIYHVKACPVGDSVKVKAKVLRIDKRKIAFWVEAWRKNELIGYGLHERYIINKEAFMSKLEAVKG